MFCEGDTANRRRTSDVKIVKYLLFSVLVIVGFLAVGERFVYHLAHFEGTYYGITFEYDLYGRAKTATLVRDKIELALAESGLDVFRVETRYLSDKKEVRTVYGTQGALSELRGRGISPKTYQSSFIGEIDIVFKEFSEIENIYESDMFYIVGTLEQVAAFKGISDADALNYFGVKDIKTDLSGSESGVYATLAFVWGIVFLLAILLTLYDVILSKKEMTVRLTLGENPYRVFLANALLDAAAYSAIFFGLSMILGMFSNVRYKFAVSCVMFAAMLIINTLINLLITRLNLKRDFSNAVGGQGTLTAAYIVKSISAVVLTLLLASNAAIIAECVDYIRQEKFFLQDQNHSYYTINYSAETRAKDGDAYEKSDENIWVEFDNLFGGNSIRLVDLSVSYDHETVLVNKNAAELMRAYISEDLYSNIMLANDEKVYIFLPEGSRKVNETAVRGMASAVFLHDKRDQEDAYLKVETYTGKSEILGIHSQEHLLRSAFLSNPIVILDNTTHLDADSYLNPLYIAYETLYSITDADFNHFIAINGLQNEIVKVTDAKGLYLYNRSAIERNLTLISTVSILLLLLEAAIILLTIRLEYTVNGVEIAIKKTLGYGTLGRIKRLILMPVLIVPICTLAAAAMVMFTSFGGESYVLAGGAILLSSETVFAAVQSAKMDRIKTSLILKGAKL
jgi:hypothetical protein